MFEVVFSYILFAVYKRGVWRLNVLGLLFTWSDGWWVEAVLRGYGVGKVLASMIMISLAHLVRRIVAPLHLARTD